MKRVSFFQPNSLFSLTVYCSVFFIMMMAACSGSKKSAGKNWGTVVVSTADSASILNNPASSNNDIANKYAAWLKVGKDTITKNIKLYRFINGWLNTPYLWGGTDKKGIDCSAFMQRLLNEVYNIQIPRTSVQQFFTNNVEPFYDHHYFSEGDLVFFSTMPGKPISHVGLYLQNNYFVSASSSKGVSIGSLQDPYWRKKYVAAGRVKIARNTTEN